MIEQRDGRGTGGWGLPPAPPAFGRGSVTGPAAHDGPGGHGEGIRRIHGEIRPRGPVAGPAPAPVPMGGVNPYQVQVPSKREPTQVVRSRAMAGRNWAVATAVIFALGALAEWGSYQSPAGNPLMSLLLDPVSSILYVCGVVASGVLGAYVLSTLRALAERARRWRPPLARSEKSITAMHLWPGRNVAGPVVILAETGVRGPGQWAWFATCLLWPIALVSVIWSDIAVGVFRAGVLTAIAAAVTAVTAGALARAMSSPDPRRMVPGSGGAGAGGTDGAAAGDGTGGPSGDAGPFWSRGLITPHRSRSPKTIVPPIDDSITALYEEKP